MKLLISKTIDKYLLISGILFFGFFGLAKSSWAAGHAINLSCGNNGNGTSWNCAASNGGAGAHNTLPPENTLIRGDTYFFSKGTIILSYYNLQDAESSTCDSTGYGNGSSPCRICFKKATEADHGPTIGWTTSLANGQTIFSSDPNDTGYTSIFAAYGGVAGSYYTFDGVYGSGPDPSAYGFKFIIGSSVVKTMQISLFYGASPIYGEYYHLAFVGPYPDTHMCAFALDGGGAHSFIQDCLFQGLDNAVHGFTEDLTIDKTWFTQIWGGRDGGCHGQQISYNGDHLTVKNSVFLGMVSWTEGLTSAISFNDARSGVINAVGWKIYNNLFIDNTQMVLRNSNSGTGGLQDMMFVNNTIVNSNDKVLIDDEGGNSSNNVVKNNLWLGSNIAISPHWQYDYGPPYGIRYFQSSIVHDHNYWDSTCSNPPAETHGQTETISKYDLFVDPDHYDYRLKTNDPKIVGQGVNLGSAYDKDKNGVSRVSSWDIGAYEYVPGGDKTPPAAPSGLSVN